MPADRSALEGRTKADLLSEARGRDIAGAASMKKAQLVDALLASDERRRIANVPLRAMLTADPDAAGDSLTLAAAGPGWWRAEWSLTAETLRRAEKAAGRAEPVLRLYPPGEPDDAHETPVEGPANTWFARVEAESPLRAALALRPVDGGRPHVLVKSRTAAEAVASAGPLPPLPEEVFGEIDRLREDEPFEFALAADLRLRGHAPPGTRVEAGPAAGKADASGAFAVVVPLEVGRNVLPLEARTAAGAVRRTGFASADFNLRVLEPDDED